MKKTLEIKILELKNELRSLDDVYEDKKIELQEAEDALRTLTLEDNSSNIRPGDSILFKDKSGEYIETMLVCDSKDNLDLVILTECDIYSRGTKLNRKFLHVESLIKDVEDDYDWKFIPDTN